MKLVDSIGRDIRLVEKLKVSTQVLLDTFLKAKNSRIIEKGEMSIFDCFQFGIIDHIFPQTHYEPLIFPKKEDFLKKLWKKRKKEIPRGVIKQSEEAINFKIDKLYSSTNTNSENQWLESQSNLYFISKPDFLTDIEQSVVNYSLDELYSKYESFITQCLYKINRTLRYLHRKNTYRSGFNKRTWFRQIIKFLFKNLDDSHRSLNNPQMLKTKGYLFYKNSNETRKYRLSF